MKPLILLALLLPLAAGAQVKKCTIEGKTVYSDSLCGQYGKAVDTSANTIDHSGLRQQAEKDRAQAAAAQVKGTADAKKYKRDHPTDSCGNAIDLSHKPSARQRNEQKRCMDARVREYNRPSN